MDFGKAALTDSEFKAKAEELHRVWEHFKELIIHIDEESPAESLVPTDPKPLLAALGMGEEEPVDPVLQKVTWKLKRVRLIIVAVAVAIDRSCCSDCCCYCCGC